jgi:hypothetical protein
MLATVHAFVGVAQDPLSRHWSAFVQGTDHKREAVTTVLNGLEQIQVAVKGRPISGQPSKGARLRLLILG